MAIGSSTTPEALIANAFVGLATGALAVVLVYGGQGKLQDLRGTTAVFMGYGAIPDPSAAFLARSVPIAELVLAILLLIPVTHQLATVCVAGLFLASSSVVAVSLLMRQIPSSCGCFGSASEHPPSWSVVIRALAMAVASAVLALFLPAPRELVAYSIGLLVALTAMAITVLVRQLESIEAVRSQPGHEQH